MSPTTRAPQRVDAEETDAAEGATRRTLRDRLRPWLTGDRRFLVAFTVLFALAALMLAGPVGRHLDSRERIEALEQRRDALHAEIDRLEARAADLDDPDHIELLAREQLGLVHPGELPYVVVVPEPERPQVAPGPPPDPEPRAWYRQVLDLVADRFR